MFKVYTTSCGVSNVDGRRRSRVVMDEPRDAVESDPASLGTIIGNTPGKHLPSLDVGDPHPQSLTRSRRVTSHTVHLHRATVMDRSTFHEQNDAFGADMAMPATGLNAGPGGTQ